MDSNIKKAAQVIKKILYINIASVTKDGKPWNTPVYTAYDKDLNFYWISWKENQHSKNLEDNPNVFVTIYDSTVPEGTGFGVYMYGKAYKISNVKDLMKAVVHGYKRKGAKVKDYKLFMGLFPRRVYKFTPGKVWVNSSGELEGEFIDTREELDLKDLKRNLEF